MFSIDADHHASTAHNLTEKSRSRPRLPAWKGQCLLKCSLSGGRGRRTNFECDFVYRLHQQRTVYGLRGLEIGPSSRNVPLRFCAKCHRAQVSFLLVTRMMALPIRASEPLDSLAVKHE